jgi:hypothetical protein
MVPTEIRESLRPCLWIWSRQASPELGLWHPVTVNKSFEERLIAYNGLHE